MIERNQAVAEIDISRVTEAIPAIYGGPSQVGKQKRNDALSGNVF